MITPTAELRPRSVYCKHQVECMVTSSELAVSCPMLKLNSGLRGTSTTSLAVNRPQEQSNYGAEPQLSSGKGYSRATPGMVGRLQRVLNTLSSSLGPNVELEGLMVHPAGKKKPWLRQSGSEPYKTFCMLCFTASKAPGA